ncbi:nuclear transport factor 2 family protein [Natronolimnohabitans sp. A-GB9]|uniref:nuclear transport factor 2 family protein n=1 Tax=Natronolimnohabitans sp. A-GB9 TaxID=3069757 RepID=UPI0027B72FB3|nr:nuclear transport factor 2 family protein [Natronolimnohabitans sp. A-GB9]MDQ2050602.1 nuclear transport factor 2 family protein [Natronolimnohabitans sp. A-GB9]
MPAVSPSDSDDTDPVSVVKQYYRALDEHDYETLEDVLTSEFVQRRPDRTFESREAFVCFMRDARPNPDTEHELETVVADGDRVAVRGRVFDGETALFEFADFFVLEDGRIGRLETYTQ